MSAGESRDFVKQVIFPNWKTGQEQTVLERKQKVRDLISDGKDESRRAYADVT